MALETPLSCSSTPCQISLVSSDDGLRSCQALDAHICRNIETDSSDGLAGRQAAACCCVHECSGHALAPDLNQQTCAIVAAYQQVRRMRSAAHMRRQHHRSQNHASVPTALHPCSKSHKLRVWESLLTAGSMPRLWQPEPEHSSWCSRCSAQWYQNCFLQRSCCEGRAMQRWRSGSMICWHESGCC